MTGAACANARFRWRAPAATCSTSCVLDSRRTFDNCRCSAFEDICENTKVVGGSVLAGGMVGLVVGAITW